MKTTGIAKTASYKNNKNNKLSENTDGSFHICKVKNLKLTACNSFVFGDVQTVYNELHR